MNQILSFLNGYEPISHWVLLGLLVILLLYGVLLIWVFRVNRFRGRLIRDLTNENRRLGKELVVAENCYTNDKERLKKQYDKSIQGISRRQSLKKTAFIMALKMPKSDEKFLTVANDIYEWLQQKE